MTFEEAVKLYLQAPTKRFGNEKSPAAHSTLLWMAARYPKGLRNPDTRKLNQYSKYLHDKNPLKVSCLLSLRISLSSS